MESYMKKFLISLVLLIPLLTGCANIDTKLTLNDDKSAVVATSLTYKGNLSDKEDVVAQNISNNYKNFIDTYYKVDTATSANLSTINAIKKVNNIEKEDLDLSSLGFESKLPSKRFIEIKKNFIIKSYNIHMVYNFPKIAKSLALKAITDKKVRPEGLVPEYYYRYINPADLNEVTSSDPEYDMASNLADSAKQLTQEDSANDKSKDAKKADDTFNIAFSVEVPLFASSNNADSVSGNIYTWNIKKNEPTEIKLQYVRYSGWAFAFIVLLGVLFLVYVAKRIHRRDSTKRMDNIENII